MNISYSAMIRDALGNLLEIDVPILGGQYVRAENQVGSLEITLPGIIDSSHLPWHGRIEIWRTYDDGLNVLCEDTVWLIVRKERKYDFNSSTWTITAEDANALMKYRIVDYNVGNAYTLKLGKADDVGKAIVRENFGALATDATRSIAAYLQVEADRGLAATHKLAFENKQVLDVLQQLAKASTESGTYLVFDVVYEHPYFVFRSYTGQRKADRRQLPGNAKFQFIGPDMGNFSGAAIVHDYSQAWTRGIISGDSTAGVFSKARVNNASMQALSPFGLIEAYRGTTNQVADSTLLTSEATAYVREGFPVVSISGGLTNAPGFIYGRDWNWGDFVTVQIDGLNYDMHVTKVQVPITSEVMENQAIDAILRTQ